MEVGVAPAALQARVEVRHGIGAWHAVVDKGARNQLTRFLIIDGLFVQRLPEALHDATMNLTGNQHRIDRPTEIIDYGIPADFRNTGFRVDLDLAYMSAVGKCWRIGLMGCCGIETRLCALGKIGGV